MLSLYPCFSVLLSAALGSVGVALSPFQRHKEGFPGASLSTCWASVIGSCCAGQAEEGSSLLLQKLSPLLNEGL